MSDGLLDKWRAWRDLKARRQAAYDAISERNPEAVAAALSKLRKDELKEDDPGELMKSAIGEQNLQSFKELLAFLGTPKVTIKIEVGDGRYSHTETYSPLSYAVEVVHTHDIAMLLANDPRVWVSDEVLAAAKEHGMQDVAKTLAGRIADQRRSEAERLDAEAGKTPAAPPANAAPAEPAKPAPDDTWALMSDTSVAHVVSSPAIGRKLTTVFNFEDRERVIITENLATGKETVGLAEKFDAISADAVKHAEEKLKTLTAEAPKRTFTL